jgi:hypothetical protein
LPVDGAKESFVGNLANQSSTGNLANSSNSGSIAPMSDLTSKIHELVIITFPLTNKACYRPRSESASEDFILEIRFKTK